MIHPKNSSCPLPSDLEKQTVGETVSDTRELQHDIIDDDAILESAKSTTTSTSTTKWDTEGTTVTAMCTSSTSALNKSVSTGSNLKRGENTSGQNEL